LATCWQNKELLVNFLPEVIPISELRLRQNELLRSLSETPVVLTQHGRAVAVLLRPDDYDRLIEQIEDLHLALDAIEARQETGPVMKFEEYLAQRDERVRATANG
jgi:prevent-host-death family protein